MAEPRGNNIFGTHVELHVLMIALSPEYIIESEHALAHWDFHIANQPCICHGNKHKVIPVNTCMKVTASDRACEVVKTQKHRPQHLAASMTLSLVNVLLSPLEIIHLWGRDFILSFLNMNV